MIKVTGSASKKSRLLTGWYSFDQAFINRKGETGWPLRLITEIYGPKGVGKSTLAACLSAKIRTDSTIEYADLETQDSEYISHLMETHGFNGTLDWVVEEQDEKLLDALVDRLSREETSCAILDSIGAISPIAERESSLADANMGRRAKLMAGFTRKVMYALRMRESSAAMIMLNHQLAAIGYVGTVTPGGQTKDYMDGVKIKLKIDEKFDDGSYLLKVMIEKNRMGFVGKEASLFMLSGHGVHEGLTAVFDCVRYKKATSDRVIKLDGKSYGYTRVMIGYAESGDPEPFQDFINALKGPAS